MSRSLSPKTVEVSVVSLGQIASDFPPFIGLIHRHFEKALPVVSNERVVTLIAPVDLLDLLVEEKILDSIESIEVTYQKRI